MIVRVSTILLSYPIESVRTCVSCPYGIEGLYPVEQVGHGYTVVLGSSGYQDHLRQFL